MRVVVFGAGAIGGVIGARLFQHGSDVTFVARGENFAALSRGGLQLEAPEETATLKIPVVPSASDLSIGSNDVVILAVKSQDTRGALVDLAKAIPPEVAIVCAQNGVENERAALRMFQNVYGVCVMCPATHLEPGVVRAISSPITGLLDVGRWPQGLDERAVALSELLKGATFDSIARHDIARWKWGKLLMNLTNAVQAVCGSEDPAPELTRRVIEEGVEVLARAGVDFVSRAEDLTRRGNLLSASPRDASRGGASTWQSLARGAGSVETDYLTGEIVLLARLHGVAAPVNELLQRLANRLALERRPPGGFSEADVLGLLERGG